MTNTNIVTPTALIQTTNGKRFYAYSGEVTVATSEVTMISADNIGERDILFHLAKGWVGETNYDLILRVKSNDIIVFADQYETASTSDNYGRDYKFIFPANTSLEVTFQLTGGSFVFTANAYGKYLSM